MGICNKLSYVNLYICQRGWVLINIFYAPANVKGSIDEVMVNTYLLTPYKHK